MMLDRTGKYQLTSLLIKKKKTGKFCFISEVCLLQLPGHN